MSHNVRVSTAAEAAEDTVRPQVQLGNEEHAVHLAIAARVD
jgi:hypothetical protein